MDVKQQEDGKWVASEGNIRMLGDTKEQAVEGLKRWQESRFNKTFCMGCGQSHDYCICSSLD